MPSSTSPPALPPGRHRGRPGRAPCSRSRWPAARRARRRAESRANGLSQGDGAPATSAWSASVREAVERLDFLRHDHRTGCDRVVLPAAVAPAARVGQDAGGRGEVKIGRRHVFRVARPVSRFSRHVGTRLQSLAEHLKRSSKLFIDETRAPVPDPGRGRTKTDCPRPLARDNRCWGGPDSQGVEYFYAPARAGKHAEKFLDGFDASCKSTAMPITTG